MYAFLMSPLPVIDGDKLQRQRSPVVESSHCSCWLPAGLRSKKFPLCIFPGHFIRVYKKGRGLSDNKSSWSELRSPNWLIVLGVGCPPLSPPRSCLPPRCPSHHLLQPITPSSATHAATRLTVCYPGPAVISCWPFEKNLSIKLCGNNTFEKEKANKEKKTTKNRKQLLCWCDVGSIIRMFFRLTNISVFGWKIISSCRELLDFYKFKQAKDRKQNLDKPQCLCQLIPLWFKALYNTWITSIFWVVNGDITQWQQ